MHVRACVRVCACVRACVCACMCVCSCCVPLSCLLVRHPYANTHNDMHESVPTKRGKPHTVSSLNGHFGKEQSLLCIALKTRVVNNSVPMIPICWHPDLEVYTVNVAGGVPDKCVYSQLMTNSKQLSRVSLARLVFMYTYNNRTYIVLQLHYTCIYFRLALC